MQDLPQPSIHSILAHSYLSYFIFSIFGLFLDTVLGFSISLSYAAIIATVCFAVGTILILWAQATSSKALKCADDPTTAPYFHCGPYRYMRNPTHLGIVFLVTGYTLVSGSIIFFAITMIGYLISNIFFKEYESVLYTKYGDQYQEYKHKVPKIF